MAQLDARLMLQAEARYWLQLGYHTPELVAELQLRIEKRRGRAAAARLVDEMREQWRARDIWWQESGQ